MSITIKEKQKRKQVIEDKLKNLNDKISKIESELDQLDNKYNDRLTCKKCQTIYEPNEVGYKTYKARRTIQNCQYGGEYDIYQTLEYQYLACCPKCGKNFGIEVKMSDTIENTPTYSRYDGKVWNFKPESCVCVDKEIHKLDRYNIKVLKENLYY